MWNIFKKKKQDEFLMKVFDVETKMEVDIRNNHPYRLIVRIILLEKDFLPFIETSNDKHPDKIGLLKNLNPMRTDSDALRQANRGFDEESVSIGFIEGEEWDKYNIRKMLTDGANYGFKTKEGLEFIRPQIIKAIDNFYADDVKRFQEAQKYLNKDE